jgi:2-oxoisovalerate dehydrogenase E2 component (dihydrolipoyl transacylase)
MSTEKAVVEVPSPVSGRIVSISGGPGDVVAVGAELVVFETDATAAAAPAPAAPASASTPAPSAAAPAATKSAPAPAAAAATPSRVMASPATRRRAREAGIDLAAVSGTGPGGRIGRADLDAVLAATPQGAASPASAPAAAPAAGVARSGFDEVKVIGVRRVIAERMAAATRTIPHFSYVEEVDVTELESLRAHLNSKLPKGSASYTYLPFLVAALVRVLEGFPQCNAHYDAERNVLLRHHPVHVGIATQTPDGLKVPVVRHAEALALPAIAAEIRRVSEAARTGRATRAELGGSTITVTSLGKLGGIASTPVINMPEVAIVGVNKAVERPVVAGGQVVVRRVMNLSSSFDHRFVDGFDAAAMIQALKERLEHPATIFMTA